MNSTTQDAFPSLAAIGSQTGRPRGELDSQYRLIKSHGIGPSPAMEQNRVVQTVQATYDPRWRVDHYASAVIGCFNGVVVNPTECYGLLKGEIFFCLGNSRRMISNRDSIHGEPFACGTTSMLNLNVRYLREMSVLGVVLNPGPSRGDPNSVQDDKAVVMIGGTHEVTNTGPDNVPNGGPVFASPYSWTKPTKALEYAKNSKVPTQPISYMPIVQIKGCPVIKMHARIVALDTRDAHQNLLLLSKQISEKIKSTPGIDLAGISVMLADTRGSNNVPEILQWAKLEAVRQLFEISLCAQAADPTQPAAGTHLDNNVSLVFKQVSEWQQFYQSVLSNQTDGLGSLNMSHILPYDEVNMPFISGWNAVVPGTTFTWLLLAMRVLNLSMIHSHQAIASWMQRFYLGNSMSAAEPGKSFTLLIKGS